MIAAQFIFEPDQYDSEFHRLDDSIEAEAAKSPGFLGVDKWVSEDGTRTNVIYYFREMNDLTKLGRFGDHREAKARNAEWYKGYRVVISEVTATYGNADHIAARSD